MWRITVEDFRELAEAAFVQIFFRTAQICFRRRNCFRRKIPRARQRFAEDRERPRPRRAVVIGGFAARVFVAFIARPIGIARVVQRAPVIAIDRQQDGNRQRRKRSQCAGHDEIFLRGGHATFRAFAGDEAEAHGEEAIAAQFVAGRSVARNDVGLGGQDIGEPAIVFKPE